MHRNVFLMALSLLALSCATTPTSGSSETAGWVKVDGEVAEGSQPDFQLPRIGAPEGVRTLSELRGRVVLVDFWASWCAPCKEAMPFYAGLQKRYSGDLTVLGVNVDEDVEAMRRSIETSPPAFEVVRDGEGKVVEAFGVEAMPTTFLLDREGKVVLVHRGFVQSDRDAFERIVQNLIER